MLVVGVALAGAIPGSICAAEPRPNAAQAVSLRVKPVLCIIDKRQPDCEMTFQVEWESSQQNDYCLGDDLSPSPLNCWVQQSSGAFDEARVVNQSFKYQLTVDGETEPLAEAKVELMNVDNSDRRRNRRSRHAWSIL
jgi:hypothetical protein